MPIRLVTISGPRGAGKSTVQNAIVKRIPDLHRIVPHTTRAPREGEVDGVDYHFVSDAEFDRLVGMGEFVWWSQVGPIQRSGTHIDEFSVGKQGAIVDVLPTGARTMWQRIDVLGGSSFSIALFASENTPRERIAKRQATTISDAEVSRLIREDPVPPRMNDLIDLGFNLLLTNEASESRACNIAYSHVARFLR